MERGRSFLDLPATWLQLDEDVTRNKEVNVLKVEAWFPIQIRREHGTMEVKPVAAYLM